MRNSAPANDPSYRLRDLVATTFLFRVKPDTQPPSLEDQEADIVAYLQSHPSASIDEMRTYIPSLGKVGYEAYNRARMMVVGLVERGILETCGEMPLEIADKRYERVETCDICGAPSQSHPTLFWKHNTPMVRCTTCGMIYSNPRWKAEYLFGRYTPEYWEQYSDKIKRTAIDPVANQEYYDPHLNYMEIVRQTWRVLDVGCATGEFLAAAQARLWQVYGVEPSPIGAALAERVPGATIHTGTLDTAPWPDGFFDAVVLLEVIEHLQSPSAYMEQIKRLVRPGGMMVLATPNIHSLAYALLGRKWDPVGPNDHLYLFAPKTLERLLNRYGFAIHHLHTLATDLETWRRWLRYPALQWLAPALRKVSPIVTDRLLLGDGIFLVARRTSETGK